jgi:hypothetical protein
MPFQTYLALDECDNSEALFLFRRSSTVKSFFTTQLIDVPICFKKSKSLLTATFELPLLKLYNMLMRSGQKSQVIKYFSISSNLVFYKWLLNAEGAVGVDWREAAKILEST